jgi:hypothetical protein
MTDDKKDKENQKWPGEDSPFQRFEDFQNNTYKDGGMIPQFQYASHYDEKIEKKAKKSALVPIFIGIGFLFAIVGLFVKKYSIALFAIAIVFWAIAGISKKSKIA